MRSRATERVLHDPLGVVPVRPGAARLDYAHAGGAGRCALFQTLREPAEPDEWLARPPLARS